MQPSDERLFWNQVARASEEERLRVEALMKRRKAGEKLQPHEEATIAYSPFGSAAGCHCGRR